MNPCSVFTCNGMTNPDHEFDATLDPGNATKNLEITTKPLNYQISTVRDGGGVALKCAPGNDVLRAHL